MAYNEGLVRRGRWAVAMACVVRTLCREAGRRWRGCECVLWGWSFAPNGRPGTVKKSTISAQCPQPLLLRRHSSIEDAPEWCDASLFAALRGQGAVALPVAGVT